VVLQANILAMQQAAILSIGDELALGQTVDTNSAWVSQQLIGRGIHTLMHQTVADDLPAMIDALRYISQRVQLLIISGGLGPTQDDLTRQAIAEAIGSKLVLDEAQLANIQGFFDRRGRPMAEANRVQALRPESGTMLTNDWGTAPGIRVRIGECEAFAVPGVPREMKAMFTHRILPALDGLGFGGDRVIKTTKVNTFGMGESTVADRIGDLMARDRNPMVGTTVAKGIVSVRVRSEFATEDQAEAELEAAAAEVEARMRPLAYSREETALQSVVVALLQGDGVDKKTQTIATAESCTGGMLAAMLTDVPGASAVVAGGWVTYSNALKTECVGVDEQLLIDHGAVSGPVVCAMAAGALQKADSDWALSTSGVAGPGGGTDDKPVGTVWIGLAQRTKDGVETQAVKVHLPGTRHEVRDRSAKCALQMLRLALLGESLSAIDWAMETIEPVSV